MVKRLNAAIRGTSPFDLLVQNAQVVNVFTEEVSLMDMAVCDGRIGLVTAAGSETIIARSTIDAHGAFAIPGLIDCHMHMESTMLTPSHFAAVVLPHGTTTVVIDPHELANVLGEEAVAYMASMSRNLPLHVLIQVPSCVPAAPGLETAGATFDGKAIKEILGQDGVVGLGEVMDYHGVICRSERMVDVLNAAIGKGTVISGHAPLVTGRDLAAYISEGPDSDHETVTVEEVVEKIRAGMVIEARLSSHSENVSLLVEALQRFPVLPHNVVFCTDDLLPNDLLDRGHMNAVVRKAISCGMSPVRAIRIASLHGALRYGLGDRGAIAPGRRADFSLCSDLNTVRPHMVFYQGRCVAKNGGMVVNLPRRTHPLEKRNTVQIRNISVADFSLSVPVGSETVKAHGMVVRGDSLLIDYKLQELSVDRGLVDLSSAEDVALAVLLERHGVNGNMGRTVVQGIGLRAGAVATTVSHDCHNLLVVGKNAEDMYLAAQTLEQCGGGFVYVQNNKVEAVLELPIGGLLSLLDAEQLVPRLAKLQSCLRNAGVMGEDPIMVFVTLALPVIPGVRLTDMGLLDVQQQTFYPELAGEVV